MITAESLAMLSQCQALFKCADQFAFSKPESNAIIWCNEEQSNLPITISPLYSLLLGRFFYDP